LDSRQRIGGELAEFLEYESYSLHIKGLAGTGKTTLALELMKGFEEKGVFLTTRIPPEKFLRFFPWLKGSLEEENIIDATNNYHIRDTKAQNVFEYIDKPDFVKNLYLKLRGRGRKLLVVDSLDALKATLSATNNTELETTLLALGEKTNTNTVFISETQKETAIDYLVDGVVKLQRRTVGGRILRERVIEKMRGIAIKKPSALFTLSGGRYTQLPYSTPLQELETPTTVNINTNRVSTSIPQLDVILGGGYKKGSFNVIELGENVGLDHLNVFFPTFVSILMQGYPQLYFPSQAICTLDITPLTRLVKERENGIVNSMLKTIHIFHTREKNENLNLAAQVHQLSGKNPLEAIQKIRSISLKTLEETQKDAFILTIGSDIITYLYGTKNFTKVLTNWVDTLKPMGAIINVFFYSETNLTIPTSFLDTHIKLEKINDTLLLYGVNPQTGIYAVTPNAEKLQTTLIPIE